MKTALVAAATVFAFLHPAVAAETAEASGKFFNDAGEESGSAKLIGTPAGVLIEIDVSGLPASQWVAFHVHEKGDCNAHGAYDSAGGHFNPTQAEHGYLAAKGPHAGDMPNQYVGADGKLHTQVFNAAVRLDDGENAIRDRALIIHAGKDDYLSQPAGNAGKRLACAVIK